jgi:hypothetical protein
MFIVMHWSIHDLEKPPGREVITTRAHMRVLVMILASIADLSPVGTSSIPSRKSTSRRSSIA